MNAEEFYNRVRSDKSLEEAFETAIDNGALDDFLKSNGCTASADEVSAYIAAHS